MNELELPEDTMDVAEARIGWAFSFLCDWLIPFVEGNRIEKPDEIIWWREQFPPRVRNGTDFTIKDVLAAALRWRAYNEEHYIHVAEARVPHSKALRHTIELLNKAIDPPEEWTQTTFLTD